MGIEERIAKLEKEQLDFEKVLNVLNAHVERINALEKKVAILESYHQTNDSQPGALLERATII